ncbi:MAG: FAD binding domain-containing protein [Lachnospiraceae bacterium]|nr:FAD binding domain-containing protein [Lachnospiraceae bacterium]
MFRAKEYVRAKSLQEAYDLNQKRSSVLLGGMMWLKMGRNDKGTAIDLSELGLDGIEEDETEFRIGCMCSLRRLEQHEGLNRYFGGVWKECTRFIVGTQFRNTATVGGSVFGRYGFSDILTCLMVLDAQVELYQGGIIPIAAFAGMKYDRDILVRVIIRKDGRRAAYTSQRRSKTDFPLIACGLARKEGIWYAAIGARPEKAVLVTAPVTEEPFEVQAKELADRFCFRDNLRGSGDYRRHLAGIYMRRLMEQLGEEDLECR